MTMICEAPSYSLAQHEPIGIYYWPINVRRNIFSLALGSPQDPHWPKTTATGRPGRKNVFSSPDL